MALSRLFPPEYVFHSANGQEPNAAGVVYFYDNGTTNLADIFTDIGGITASSNPLTLGSDGRLPNDVYSSTSLRVRVNSALGAQISQDDNVAPDSAIDAFSGSGGSALVGFIQSGTGAVARTAQAKLRDVISGADFGMVGDGSTDNKTAFDNAVAAAIAGSGKLFIPPGNYRFNSRPAIITSPVHIFGASMSESVLERNYNASGASGFITIQALGVNLSDLSINAIAGTTNGSAVEISSTSSLATSFVTLENLNLSTYGTNTWQNTLQISGTDKTTAPIGTRDLSLRNIHVFGASSSAVFISGAVGLTWFGGGVYLAGGSNGGITITGDATVNSYYPMIAITNVSSDVILSYCTYADISATAFAGGIQNTNTALFCKIRGSVVGAVQNNWANSGIERSEKLHGSATFNPASLADGAGETTTVTVTGAALGDYAQCSFSLDLQGITTSCWVSGSNTVSVRLQNETGGTIDLASGTLRAQVTKPQA